MFPMKLRWFGQTDLGREKVEQSSTPKIEIIGKDFSNNDE